jgi:hypothetical protein
VPAEPAEPAEAEEKRHGRRVPRCEHKHDGGHQRLTAQAYRGRRRSSAGLPPKASTATDEWRDHSHTQHRTPSPRGSRQGHRGADARYATLASASRPRVRSSNAHTSVSSGPLVEQRRTPALSRGVSPPRQPSVCGCLGCLEVAAECCAPAEASQTIASAWATAVWPTLAPAAAGRPMRAHVARWRTHSHACDTHVSLLSPRRSRLCLTPSTAAARHRSSRRCRPCGTPHAARCPAAGARRPRASSSQDGSRCPARHSC